MGAADTLLLKLDLEKAAEEHECDLVGSKGPLLGVRQRQRSLRQVSPEVRMMTFIVTTT